LLTFITRINRRSFQIALLATIFIAHLPYATAQHEQHLGAIQKHFPDVRASHMAKLDTPLQKKLATGEVPALIVILNHQANTNAVSARSVQAKKKQLENRRENNRQRILQQGNRLVKHLAANKNSATITRRFEHIPIAMANAKNWQDLSILLDHDDVSGLSSSVEHTFALAQSNPIISQPIAVANSITGSGTTVAVFDTGVDYTHSDFGSCTSPGIPASCRVLHAQDFAAEDSQLDDYGHGTVVSGIVAGVASEADLVVLDVFNNSGGASTEDIIAAINWVVANATTYNIVAANFSLSQGDERNDNCDMSSRRGKPSPNPFTAAFNSLIAVDILPVAASGNNRYTNGISSPSCVTPALSVGATYDFSFNGTITWGETPNTCTDTNSSVDDIACFSNSGANLDLLAPGAFTDVAGLTGYGGTSMAAPHVAAAAAMIKQQFPLVSYATVEQRLKASNTVLTDNRNGFSFPRLDLQYSLDLIDTDNDGTLDLYDPSILDPCLPSTFNASCNQDSDGDGSNDFSEGANADSDADGIANYLESSVSDADSDGVFDELDAANHDPCLPSPFNSLCTQDSDGDGLTDYAEGELADTDNDGTANYLDSSINDTDSDGIVDEIDATNTDPCLPSAFNSQCLQDSDDDGATDYTETETADTDADGIADYLESSLIDTDADGITNQFDNANNEPCLPVVFNSQCSQDSDADGNSDFNEGETTDSDNDGIADYLESFLTDTDSDGLNDQLDPANADACIPSQFATPCSLDSDSDGKADSVEGELSDGDTDDIADYLESSLIDTDNDGVTDEFDPANNAPCIPNVESEACDIPKVNVPIPGWLLLVNVALFFAIIFNRRRGSVL
jgi:subtilisin family serine protease